MGTHSLIEKYSPVSEALKGKVVGEDYPLPDFGVADKECLKGYRVALVTTHGPELPEFHVPLHYLRERGATVDVVTQDWLFDYQPEAPGMVMLAQWLAVNVCVRADKKVSEAKTDDYDAVVTIGGAWNPIMLRTDSNIINFIKGAKERNLLIASICHGPQLLISTQAFPPGTSATGVSDIRLDMSNAGFHVLGSPIVYDKDQRLITSPGPKALKEFCEEIGRRLLEIKEKKTTNTAINETDVKQFVRDWFDKFDNHPLPPVDEMLSFLSDEKFVLKTPDGSFYYKHEGFKKWYKSVENYIKPVHTIRALEAKTYRDTATVEIVVQWQATDSSVKDAESRSVDFYAAQTWKVERMPENQRLFIVWYNIDYLIRTVQT